MGDHFVTLMVVHKGGEDIDEILGKGVYDADPQLPITRPTALQILL